MPTTPPDPTDPVTDPASNPASEAEQAAKDTLRVIQALQRAHVRGSAYYSQMSNPLRRAPNPSFTEEYGQNAADSLVAASNLRFLCASYPDVFRILVGDHALKCFVVGCARTTHLALAISYTVLTSATAMRDIYPRDRYLFGRYYMDNLLPRPVGIATPSAAPWMLPASKEDMPSISELYDLSEQVARIGMPLPPLYRQAQPTAEPDVEPDSPADSPADSETPATAPVPPERLVIYPLCISHLPVINRRSSGAINQALDIHRALACPWPCERVSFTY